MGGVKPSGTTATVILVNRRSVRIVAGVAVVAIVAIGIGGFAAMQLRENAPAGAMGAPHFVEEASAAGIDHAYDGDFVFSVGGGVAVFDCNGDGRPDLFLAGGSDPAALYRNDSPVGGALRFSPIHDPVVELAGVEGAYPLDIDGDGQVDLAVLRNGGNVLLRGLGDCRFERANERWGLDGGSALTTAFSATWEDPRALPTLAFGNYVRNWDDPDPDHMCSDNELVRPAADGAHYAAPITLTPGYCALSMLFSDWDRSGRRDLRVSNDRHYYDTVNGQEQLWRVSPGQAPRLYTAADGWLPVQIEGMGIASYDVTGDGYPDVFLTSQAANRLQTLTAGPDRPTYGDIGLKRGVNAVRPFVGGDPLPSTAWHPEFQDVNNDGFVDLFISKGNVDEEPDFAQKDPSNLLLGQPDGTFIEGAEAAGILDFSRGRGAALADFNLDGTLDLVESNFHGRTMLWRNLGSGDATQAAPMGHWIAVQLTEPAPNRDAIGAWIEVKVGDVTLQRELTVGGGHVGGQLGWIHFGLGSRTDAQVRVQWPDGETGPWMPATADQFAIIERGATAVRPWLPPRS